MKADRTPNASQASGGLMTARQAAQFLSIGLRTLWSLTTSNEIPHVRIGRSVRFDPADLARWIERKKEGPREQ